MGMMKMGWFTRYNQYIRPSLNTNGSLVSHHKVSQQPSPPTLQAASNTVAEHSKRAAVVFSSLLGLINLRCLGVVRIPFVRCGKCISISQSPQISLYKSGKMKQDCQFD